MSNNELTNRNEHILVEQLLGRPPRFPYKVSTRCPGGTPQVLATDPVYWEDDRWKPFPTYLWLVCPRLKLAIAHLEQDTHIKKFSQQLRNDENFRDLFISGQTMMAEQRLKAAREKVGESLPKHIFEILKTSTIAGSKDYHGVKCLHAHVAQELVLANNPIGREVLAITGRCTAARPCVIEPAKEKAHD